MRLSPLVFVWPLGLALGVLLGNCAPGHRCAGAPTKACVTGQPVVVEEQPGEDAGPTKEQPWNAPASP